MAEFWAEIERHHQVMGASGELEANRRKQALDWMWSMIESGLHQLFKHHPAVHAALPGLSCAVAEGRTTPGAAAHLLLNYLKV